MLTSLTLNTGERPAANLAVQILTGAVLSGVVLSLVVSHAFAHFRMRLTVESGAFLNFLRFRRIALFVIPTNALLTPCVMPILVATTKIEVVDWLTHAAF